MGTKVSERPQCTTLEVMRETMPTSHTSVKGVLGSSRPGSLHPALLVTVARAALRESPVPRAPFIPRTLSSEGSEASRPSPALTFSSGGRRATEWASLHTRRSGSRVCRLRGPRDAGGWTAAAPASCTPPAQSYWAAELLISALSRKLFAPYKNKTPAFIGARRRSLRTTCELPPRCLGPPGRPFSWSLRCSREDSGIGEPPGEKDLTAGEE